MNGFEVFEEWWFHGKRDLSDLLKTHKKEYHRFCSKDYPVGTLVFHYLPSALIDDALGKELRDSNYNSIDPLIVNKKTAGGKYMLEVVNGRLINYPIEKNWLIPVIGDTEMGVNIAGLKAVLCTGDNPKLKYAALRELIQRGEVSFPTQP